MPGVGEEARRATVRAGPRILCVRARPGPPSGRSVQTVLVSEQRSAGMRRPRVIDTKGIAMSESIDDTPVADDEVEEILADEESAEEAARSLPEEGSDDDPGSIMNR